MTPHQAWDKYMEQVHKVQQLRTELKEQEFEMDMRHKEWKRALREHDPA